MITMSSDRLTHPFSPGGREPPPPRRSSSQHRGNGNGAPPAARQTQSRGNTNMSIRRGRSHSRGPTAGGGFEELKSSGRSTSTCKTENITRAGGHVVRDVRREVQEHSKYKSNRPSHGANQSHDNYSHSNARDNFRRQQEVRPEGARAVPSSHNGANGVSQRSARGTDRSDLNNQNSNNNESTLDKYLDRCQEKKDGRAKDSESHRRVRPENNVVNASRRQGQNENSGREDDPTKINSSSGVRGRQVNNNDRADPLAASRARSKSRNARKATSSSEDNGNLDRLNRMDERARQQNTSASNTAATSRRGAGARIKDQGADGMAASRARSKSRQPLPPPPTTTIKKVSEYYQPYSSASKHSNRGRSTSRKPPEAPPAAIISMSHDNRTTSDSDDSLTVVGGPGPSSVKFPSRRRIGCIGQSADFTRGRSRSRNHTSEDTHTQASVKSFQSEMRQRIRKTHYVVGGRRSDQASSEFGDSSRSSLRERDIKSSRSQSRGPGTGKSNRSASGLSKSLMNTTTGGSGASSYPNSPAEPSSVKRIASADHSPPKPSKSTNNAPSSSSSAADVVVSNSKSNSNNAKVSNSKLLRRDSAAMTARGASFCSEIYDYLNDYDATKKEQGLRRSTLRHQGSGGSSVSGARPVSTADRRRSSGLNSSTHSNIMEESTTSTPSNEKDASTSGRRGRSVARPVNNNNKSANTQRQASRSSRLRRA